MKYIIWILSLLIILFLSSCPMPFDDIVNMSSRELIEYKTRGVRNARLTVGIVQNGQMLFTVYGKNGRILPNIEHIYEIGSISKPITAQLFARAISENRVSLNDQIDRFLALTSKTYYPTIRRLLTHTSGYRIDYYMGSLATTNFLPFGNPFYGMTRRMVLDQIGRINLENRDYPFEYSNFGFAVAGLVLEEIFEENFTSLMNNYLRNDLGLSNTRVGDGRGDLSNYWRWNDGNPGIASGGLVSTITDMMKFAQMQIDEYPSYVSDSHDVLAQIPQQWFPSGFFIRDDAMGLGWIIDEGNGIIWHSGETTTFCTFVGFDKAHEIAVVVLSNFRQSLHRPIDSFMIGSAIIKELRN